MKAISIYRGSNASLTKVYYAELATHGTLGVVAMNLMRAQKNSARAKAYHGGPAISGSPSYRKMAYDRKEWAMVELRKVLAGSSLVWGWKEDPANSFAPWVLYVEIPTGQVSFHALVRGVGPAYRGKWDQSRNSAERIIQFCDQVIEGRHDKEAPGQTGDLFSDEGCLVCSREHD